MVAMVVVAAPLCTLTLRSLCCSHNKHCGRRDVCFMFKTRESEGDDRYNRGIWKERCILLPLSSFFILSLPLIGTSLAASTPSLEIMEQSAHWNCRCPGSMFRNT